MPASGYVPLTPLLPGVAVPPPLAVAAPPVTVVDTVGAGDAFTAGLLSAMDADGALGPDGASFGSAQVARWLARAVAAGSWACARRGAQAPALADLGV